MLRVGLGATGLMNWLVDGSDGMMEEYEEEKSRRLLGSTAGIKYERCHSLKNEGCN